MEKKINIGLVIADGDEFLPLEKMMPKLGGEELSVAGRRAYTFSVGKCLATGGHCGILPIFYVFTKKRPLISAFSQ